MDPGDVQERVRGGCFGASRGETGQEMVTGVDVEFKGEIARNLFLTPLSPPFFFKVVVTGIARNLQCSPLPTHTPVYVLVPPPSPFFLGGCFDVDSGKKSDEGSFCRSGRHLSMRW